MDKKQEVVNKELSKNTKVLLDSMGKLNKTILDNKSVTFQKRFSVKQLFKIYEPMLREYLKDEDVEYQKEIKTRYNTKSNLMVSNIKSGSTEKDLEEYKKFYTHLVEVTTTRKTTMDKLEELWK